MRLTRDESRSPCHEFIIQMDPHEDTEAVEEQLHIFVLALAIYAERNVKYKDNWKNMGWRGQLIRVRERAERLWDDLWDGEPNAINRGVPEPDVDDAIDLINFAAFLVRGVRAGNRDGTWW